MFNIIVQKLKEQRNSVLIYAGVIVGYMFMLISLFPSIQKMDIQAVMQQMPKQMTEFFGTDLFAAYGTIEGYLSAEFLAFFFILIVSFYLGSAAGSAIAGQIEKKTIDFNLSQPVSRTKMLFSEILVGLFYGLIIIAITILAMFVLGKAWDLPFKNDGLLAFGVIGTLFVWSIYGISIFLSSFLRSKTTTMLLTFGISLFFFVFSSLTRMIDKIKDLDKFSLFYLYNPNDLLRTGQINIHHVIALVSILIIGGGASLVIFNKKDV